jgi:predicted RNA-binding protein with PUA-like domain
MGRVPNYQARNNMSLIKLSGQAFFYHSQKKAVVDIFEVCDLAHPNSSTNDPR